MDLVERFKKYIAFDTMSSETSGLHPSSHSQLEFGDMLIDDLSKCGVNALKDEHGYIYLKIENGKEKTIGLIAHMDTAPTIAGGCKNTKIIKNYDGKPIVLNEKYTMSPLDFPILNTVKGEDLIVTDGEHLLGGDDKAGLTIIFEFVLYYLKHKDEFNYNLAVCFTPDEEIGEGPLFFDNKKMKADIAFTLDGESIYEANFENFNASIAKVYIKGVGVHPGNAKNVMVNAASIGTEFVSYLPKDMVPEKTEGKEGFIHLCEFKGDVEECYLEFILRDHDSNLLQKQKDLLKDVKEKIEKEHPKVNIELQIKDQYKNMFDYFVKDDRAIRMINNAYLNKRIRLSYLPIRGGTDGATITYMGLPCPNLGDGDFNPHGRYEFVSITQMYMMVEIIKEIFKGRIL